MKNCYPFLFALTIAACNSQRIEWTSEINDFEAVKAQFAEPSNHFGTAPLWVWNTKVTDEIIDASLKDLKDKGFGGVFIHPRPGMITSYLSDEWFALYKHTIAKGKELGLDVWIYDENSYPSGFAGGHVPDQMPESYNQGQSLVVEKVNTIPENIPSQWFIVLKREGDKTTDITASIKSEIGKEGDYYAFKKGYYGRSAWYGGYSYVDLLMPGVTEKFIEITMDAYKREIGEEFGKTVPGWFTDEPNINPPAGGIKWTPDLFDYFEKQWGYSLKENLPSLFEGVGDWRRVRHNYSQTLLDLFIARWAVPCYEYCEANNLKFTGHYWEHGWPKLADGPDNMAMYAWHQQPAIDMLFNQYNDVSSEAQFGNIRAVKELRSVANQLGRNRTLSETYGGGGWDETFRDFKRLGDWEYVLGVNFMNQHIADLSIAGARKYDYPPVFSQVEPWWEHYRTLNMHFARLSMALSAGEQVNDILVFEPTTSVWMYYAYGRSDPHYYEIGRTFQQFETSLEKQQLEYDLASEDIVKRNGSVKGGKLVVGKRAYSTVVIPPLTENLDAVSFSLLKKFVAGGGKIITYAVPQYIDGQKNEEPAAFFADNSKVVTGTYSKGTDVDLSIYPKQKITFNNVSKSKDLYHQRRDLKDGQLLFIVNSSLKEQAIGHFTIEKGKNLLELRTMTGEIFEYKHNIKPDGTLEGHYILPPAGSLLLYVANKQLDGYAPADAVEYKGNVAPVPGSEVIKPLDDNALTIDFCDLTIGKEKDKDLHLYYAADKAFKAHGFNYGNPWNTSVQFKSSTLDRDTFKTGGFTVDYHFTVAEDFDYSSMKAVVERSSLYKVTINGAEIKTDGKRYFDREMDVIAIGNHVRKGLNTITLSLAPFKVLAEIEQVIILGNFRVQPSEKGFKIVAPATTFTAEPWKAQGYPFYAKSFSYSKKFNISDLKARYAVGLGTWNGTVSEVIVNGKSAGLGGFTPYEYLDVSKLLKEGENVIDVRIAGSNQNLLGPFHNNRTGLVSPGDFRNVRVYPAGDKYRQYDYGLYSGFELKMAD
ncbi:MAG: hypothetical protein LBR50_05430 [Tannerella sp.]|jgi:hypothetical protein|nr:hypothetical protein [Tannerella sp.]